MIYLKQPTQMMRQQRFLPPRYRKSLITHHESPKTPNIIPYWIVGNKPGTLTMTGFKWIAILAIMTTLMMAVMGEGDPPRRYRKEQYHIPTEQNVESKESLENWNAILHEENVQWGRALLDGTSLSMSMDLGSCVPPDVPEFIIDANVDIGDTLIRPGPGFARKCGDDCYTVKDNGDDPPFDPELGDTLRFAYKKVSSNNFSIRSRVCGTDCDDRGCDDCDRFGRTGLMVREDLDPLARNIYVSHTPNLNADWTYRTEPGEMNVGGQDFSVDVTCLWITLERNGNEFNFSYAYEGKGKCDLDEVNVFDDMNQTVTINMPEEVYVGLAVSTGVAPPFCPFTEADFRDIECRGCT